MEGGIGEEQGITGKWEITKLKHFNFACEISKHTAMHIIR